MLKEGENLYIGTNEVPNNNVMCNCEHLRLDIDFGVPHNHEDSIKSKCNILTKKFLIVFRVNKKCDYFKDKNFARCNLYVPSVARGTL